jgi:lipid A disaccharide synthetase
MLESNNKIDQLILDLPESVAYYQQKSPTNWPGITKSQNIDMLPATIKEQFTQDYIRQEGIFSLLPQERQSELSFAKQGYVEAQKTIDQMIKLGIVISGPPIKKQTLAEKAKIVKNFDQLTEIYNQWATNNPGVATPIAAQDVLNQIQQENQFWHKSTTDLISHQSS